MSRPRKARLVPVIAMIVAGVVAAFFVSSYVWLSQTSADAALASRTSGRPAKTYEEAVAAFDAVRAKEAGMALHDLCASTLLSHGARAGRVVIYFHGFSSCPAQGDELAAKLFAMGYNVYLPRMPGHGELVPSAEAMAELSAEHLIELANESVDMAHGLGDEIVVTGLSAGGTLAAWTAQNRADVDHAILVSPFFGPHVVPPWAMRAATNLALRAPDVVFAWNPLQDVDADSAAIPQAMPTTHALAEVMLVGWAVRDSAQERAPAAAKVSVLLNDADIAVSNAMTEEIIAYWRSHGAEVTVEVLPRSSRLPHDLINPRETGANTGMVYPALIDLMQRTALVEDAE